MLKVVESFCSKKKRYALFNQRQSGMASKARTRCKVSSLPANCSSSEQVCLLAASFLHEKLALWSIYLLSHNFYVGFFFGFPIDIGLNKFVRFLRIAAVPFFFFVCICYGDLSLKAHLITSAELGFGVSLSSSVSFRLQVIFCFSSLLTEHRYVLQGLTFKSGFSH